MATDRIEREILIDSSVQRVWEILTGADHMRQWFGGASARIDLRREGAIVFHWQEHGTFHARIERLEPPHVFAYRWALTPDEVPRAGNSTLVEFTLVEEGGGTRLRVVETGFQELAGTDAERAKHVSDNVAGWSGALTGIRTYAASRGVAQGVDG